MNESEYDRIFDKFEVEIRESLYELRRAIYRYKRDIIAAYAIYCITGVIAIYFLLKYV